MQVFRFNSVIPPMQAIGLVPHDPHRRSRIDPGFPQIGTRRVAKVMNAQVTDPGSTTRGLKRRIDSPHRLSVIQEHPTGVQSSFLTHYLPGAVPQRQDRPPAS